MHNKVRQCRVSIGDDIWIGTDGVDRAYTGVQGNFADHEYAFTDVRTALATVLTATAAIDMMAHESR